MENTYKIVSFIKFGSEEDMYDLFDNGTIYMNAINKFRTIEDKKLRGDSYEGVNKIRNFPSGQLEIPSINYIGNYISLHLKESYKNVLGNIYSLYCISAYGFKSPNDIVLDKRLAEFGSYSVLIKNVPDFLNRMRIALTSITKNFDEGFVEYYNKYEVNGTISIFHKTSEFEYQKEFRFYVDRDEISPLIFKLGSLKEIAEIIPSKSIIQLKAIIDN
jgi:hypothetical protein